MSSSSWHHLSQIRLSAATARQVGAMEMSPEEHMKAAWALRAEQKWADVRAHVMMALSDRQQRWESIPPAGRSWVEPVSIWGSEHALGVASLKQSRLHRRASAARCFGPFVEGSSSWRECCGWCSGDACPHDSRSIWSGVTRDQVPT